MFNLFTLISKKPLLTQIEHYCAWKGIRYPYKVSTQRYFLLEFSKHSRIRHVSDGTFDHVRSFMDLWASEYQRLEAVHALRQLFIYCKAMGIPCIQLAPVMPTGMMPTYMKKEPQTLVPKIHHSLLVHFLKEAKELKDTEGLTYREIKVRMESKHGRKFDLKTLNRWYHYQLPEGM